MRKMLLWVVAVIGLLAVGLALYIRFEYTLVPELREAIAGTDEKAGAELGRVLFRTRGCAGCHTLEGTSESSIGPDLTNLATRATRAAVMESIAEPDATIATNRGERECAAGLMPRYGELLGPREIEALTEYLFARR